MLEPDSCTIAISIAWYSNYAAEMFKNRCYQQALICYSQAIFLSSELNPKFFNDRAVVFSELEEFNNAISDLNQAIALNQNIAIFYYNRAAVLLAQKKLFPALADCRNANLLDPQNEYYQILTMKLNKLLQLSQRPPEFLAAGKIDSESTQKTDVFSREIKEEFFRRFISLVNLLSKGQLLKIRAMVFGLLNFAYPLSYARS